MKGTCGSDARDGLRDPRAYPNTGAEQGGIDGYFPLDFPFRFGLKETRAHLTACTGTKEQTSQLT